MAIIKLSITAVVFAAAWLSSPQLASASCPVTFFHDCDKDVPFLSGTTWNYWSGHEIGGYRSGFLEEDFQSHRSGVSGYSYKVEDLVEGLEYLVRLGFAEVYEPNCKVGRRVMHVSVNGNPLMSDIDVFAEAGCFSAFVVEQKFQLQGSAVMEIEFTSTVENPMVSIIEVTEDCSTEAPTFTPTATPTISAVATPDPTALATTLPPTTEPSQEVTAVPTSLVPVAATTPAPTAMMTTLPPTSAPTDEPTEEPYVCYDGLARCYEGGTPCCEPLVCQERRWGWSWCLTPCNKEVGSLCGGDNGWCCDGLTCFEGEPGVRTCHPQCTAKNGVCGPDKDPCCGDNLECRVNTTPVLRCMPKDEPIVTSAPTVATLEPSAAPTSRCDALYSFGGTNPKCPNRPGGSGCYSSTQGLSCYYNARTSCDGTCSPGLIMVCKQYLVKLTEGDLWIPDWDVAYENKNPIPVCD